MQVNNNTWRQFRTLLDICTFSNALVHVDDCAIVGVVGVMHHLNKGRRSIRKADGEAAETRLSSAPAWWCGGGRIQCRESAECKVDH